MSVEDYDQKEMFQKWDYAYMDTAKRFANLSSARRKQVGAVVVKEKNIISIGYNGMPSGWSNVCEDESTFRTKEEVYHAEANAILKLAGSHESAKDATMYCTCLPCLECAKMIYASGIHIVVYNENYNSDHRQMGGEFLKQCGVAVRQMCNKKEKEG
jgi:dCMP deaminase